MKLCRRTEKLSKKIAAGVLALLLSAAAGLPANAAGKSTVLSGHAFRVDGVECAVQAYLIDDTNYIRLEDAGELMKNGARGTFSDLGDPGNGSLWSSVVKLKKGGTAGEYRAFHVNGVTCYRLRDMAEFFGFTVSFDATTNSVRIRTDGVQEPDVPAPEPEPAPAPEPVPVPEPEPEPAPAPVPEPEPEPAPAPEPVPEPEPEPAPAPEPVPEPEPEPAPAPEPVPEPEPEPVIPQEAPVGYDITLPWTEPVDTSWFDDAAFIGDSTGVLMAYYTGDRGLGGAAMLVAGNFGCWWASQPVTETSPHPVWGGLKLPIADMVQAFGSKKVFIKMGMNDLAAGVDNAYRMYVDMVDAILEKSPDAQIYIESLTPMIRDAASVCDFRSNYIIRVFNESLKQLCRDRGYVYLDLYWAMADAEGYLPDEYCCDIPDMGFHLTFSGIEKQIEYIRSHVTPVG